MDNETAKCAVFLVIGPIVTFLAWKEIFSAHERGFYQAQTGRKITREDNPLIFSINFWAGVGLILFFCVGMVYAAFVVLSYLL